MMKRLIPITVILIALLSSSDGTVTSGDWKAKKVSWGPIDRDTKNPRIESIAVPDQWFAVDFDDIALDNVVLFRYVVKASPDGKERIDFRNLNNIVPENPPRGQGRPGRGWQGRNEGAKK